jgi:hypothetical protein
MIEPFDVRPRTAGYMNPSINAFFPEKSTSAAPEAQMI